MSSAFAQTGQNLKIDNTFRDTNNYAILSIAEFKIYSFDSTYKPTILTAKEVEIVEALFFKAIDEYNKKMSKFIDSIYKDLKDYKSLKERVEMKNDLLIPISAEFYSKQLLPAINKKGEKEVYINCFRGNPDTDFWKSELIEVLDGGNIFFHLTVNIAQGIFYNIRINDYG